MDVDDPHQRAADLAKLQQEQTRELLRRRILHDNLAVDEALLTSVMTKETDSEQWLPQYKREQRRASAPGPALALPELTDAQVEEQFGFTRFQLHRGHVYKHLNGRSYAYEGAGTLHIDRHIFRPID
jgi:hypothetical protein